MMITLSDYEFHVKTSHDQVTEILVGYNAINYIQRVIDRWIRLVTEISFMLAVGWWGSNSSAFRSGYNCNNTVSSNQTGGG